MAGTGSATFSVASNVVTINLTGVTNAQRLGVTLSSVNDGANQSFTIPPNTGYHVADVLVNGGSVGAVTSYTFTNVTANQTISAT